MSIITVSRMYGSGGSEIAARIAAALGWNLLDNSLVDLVAARLGASRREVEAREERVPSFVQRLVDAMAVGTPEMPAPIIDGPLPPSEERMLEVTRRVIAESVSRGSVVLVGRGAQALLAERADAIHVFCHAPLAALGGRIAERHGLTRAEAEKRVQETNRDRAQYVRKHWNRVWDAHENYHVCLNTEWLGPQGCAEIIVRLARERFGE